MAGSGVTERARLDASLKEMVHRIRATGNPQKIVLFGSRVTRTQRTADRPAILPRELIERSVAPLRRWQLLHPRPEISVEAGFA